jgi:hypothetical protein
MNMAERKGKRAKRGRMDRGRGPRKMIANFDGYNNTF